MNSINNSNGGNKFQPPSKNEFELSLFGPGYGEGMALHIGNNKWIIIDSCINLKTKEPAILEYLLKIGIRPEKDVVQVIATHWHDDHIRGLAKIYEICESAEFLCSDAINHEEFSQLIIAYGTRSMLKSNTSGSDEFYSILNQLRNRKKFPEFASENSRIYSAGAKNSACSCNIYALSPSAYSKIKSLKDIKKVIPKNETKGRLMPFNANFASIVILIQIENYSILLGSDLENTVDPNSGWNIIINKYSSKRYPKASIYKIPHHGSNNADVGDIWAQLLKTNPIAVLTPLKNGGTILPKKSDITRILHNTNQAFITTHPFKHHRIKREPAVERTLREIGAKVGTINMVCGHIQIRKNMNKKTAPPVVKLFKKAIPLNTV